MQSAYPRVTARAVLFSILCMAMLSCSTARREDAEMATTGGGRPAQSASPARPAAPNPMALGSGNAPLTILEFSDYQCPYCRRFHVEVLPALRQAYIDPGKVQLIFKDYPLSMHSEAMPAALAGRCAAAQGKFWPMNEALFANQARLAATLYSELAESLQLDTQAFATCLKNPALITIIQKDQEQALSLGVNATPSFLIGRMQGGRMLIERVTKGFVSFEALSTELDGLLSAPKQ